jgi:hypothetical protein
MAAAGKPLEDEDSISYVLVGHDQDYNLFMESVSGKDEISLRSLYSQFEGPEKATRGGERGDGSQSKFIDETRPMSQNQPTRISSNPIKTT